MTPSQSPQDFNRSLTYGAQVILRELTGAEAKFRDPIELERLRVCREELGSITDTQLPVRPNLSGIRVEILEGLFTASELLPRIQGHSNLANLARQVALRGLLQSVILHLMTQRAAGVEEAATLLQRSSSRSPNLPGQSNFWTDAAKCLSEHGGEYARAPSEIIVTREIRF